jgi:hypothetical protein
MRVELSAVAKGRRMHALPETSLAFESGTAVLICAETEQRPSVLGLIASGRMQPDAGTVTMDRKADAGALRRCTALVDAPHVSEPEPNVSVSGVVAEELMFAGLASHPIAARRWLDELGAADIASTPIGNVAPEQRIRILCELAALRPGVSALVITSPDRHGGEPEAWWSIAEDFADRGFAVLVIAGRASQSVLSRAVVAEPAAEPDAAASEDRTIAPKSEGSPEVLRRQDDPPTHEDPEQTEGTRS